MLTIVTFPSHIGRLLLPPLQQVGSTLQAHQDQAARQDRVE